MIQFPVYCLSALLPASDNDGILMVFGDEPSARGFARAGGLVNGTLYQFNSAAELLAFVNDSDHSRIRQVWSLPEIDGRQVRFRCREGLLEFLVALAAQSESDSKADLN